MKNNITLIACRVREKYGRCRPGKAPGRRFVDSDLVIQDRHGKLLHELITEYGVEGFWQIESDVNASLDLENSIMLLAEAPATSRKACSICGRSVRWYI